MANSLSDPSISLSPSGGLVLTFPHNALVSHSVEIPSDENGLRLLRMILNERKSGKTKLGQNGNPTQAMIQLWLKDKYEKDAITLREEMKLAKEELSAEFS